MLCKRCAAPIEDGEKICIHCGADQEDLKKNKKAKEENTDKSMTFFDCLVTFFIGGIPVIGFIMLLIWSFSSEKIKGRATIARAFLLWPVFVSLLISVIFIYCFYNLFYV